MSDNSYGITAISLGVVSFIIPYIGFFLAILAIIFAILQLRRQVNSIAISGLVLGVCSIVIPVLFLLLSGFNALLPASAEFYVLPEFPSAVSVSHSMEHEGTFALWWAEHEDFYLARNITKASFSQFPLSNGFNKGDVLLLVGASEENVELGDILVFWSAKPYPIPHRVVSITTDDQTGERIYQTKGDNNRNQVKQPPLLDETDIRPDQIAGKVALRIPYAGYMELIARDLITYLK